MLEAKRLHKQAQLDQMDDALVTLQVVAALHAVTALLPGTCQGLHDQACKCADAEAVCLRLNVQLLTGCRLFASRTNVQGTHQRTGGMRAGGVRQGS